MRLTWLVLGVVVAAGAVAFINTDDAQDDLPQADVGQAGGPNAARALNPALSRTDGSANPKGGFDLSVSEEDAAAEKRAKLLLKKLAETKAGGQAEGSRDSVRLAAQLRSDPAVWAAPSTRHHAYLEGRRLAFAAGKGQGKGAIAKKDKARRLLSRVLYLPEMFTAAGAPTPERTRLIAAIQKLNRQIMLYRPGVAGVTVPYEVPKGIVPVQIVSRQKLPMGSNALLFWNQGGNLDARRMRGGQTLLLPQEELTLHVSLRYRRLGIFMGGWFVKEWRVGVGAEDSPTPMGTFRILSRQINPDWTPRGKKTIRWGDPRNALGDAWMAFENEEWPRDAGFGIHGTNEPKTVGTSCSQGCVRLVNPAAVELRDWVRTASAGGKATRVFIQ